jgi:hypothetical protein
MEQCRPVSANLGGATVVVVGQGDLGARVVIAAARLPVGRVVAISRDAERARQVAGQSAVIAALTEGAQRVTARGADAGDAEAMATTLRELDPAVIVMAASRHTWWRTPPAFDALPYGAWLPLHVGLTRELVRARDGAGISAPIVALPYPDAVGPVLAPLGLAPEVGAGNVSEIAAKLQMLAATAEDVAREDVWVRLIAHHAVERAAFAEFVSLAGDADRVDPGPPPWRATMEVGGRAVPEERVREWFHAPHPLMPGRQTHVVTAAAAAAVVDALLADTPRRVHVPAPGGRPGGYPARLSTAGVTLDLPADVSEAQAIAINATAARWDGIERIDGDGTVTFTADVCATTERVLGLRLDRVTAADMDAVADELAARLRAAA